MAAGKAFDRLEPELQAALRTRVQYRIAKFLKDDRDPAKCILLVGDRPAPDAPDDDRFHFVPFGAEHHSSLWLNLRLHQAEIPERMLAWVNAADRHGNNTNPDILRQGWKRIIALGGAARTWCTKADVGHYYTLHPQAWKRFHAKKTYPLIDILNVELRRLPPSVLSH